LKRLFLIIGAPGSGKTTNAEIIAKNSPLVSHYSTGDMLREEVASASSLGIEINKYISKGLIVPIEIAIETITKAIKSAPTDIILLDGYPRSIEQMQALEDFLKSDNQLVLEHVIEISVSESTARERVLGRSRGADDKSEIFDNRMKVYLEPLSQIERFYSQKGVFKTISAEGSIEEIVALVQNFLESCIGKKL